MQISIVVEYKYEAWLGLNNWLHIPKSQECSWYLGITWDVVSWYLCGMDGWDVPSELYTVDHLLYKYHTIHDVPGDRRDAVARFDKLPMHYKACVLVYLYYEVCELVYMQLYIDIYSGLIVNYWIDKIFTPRIRSETTRAFHAHNRNKH